MADPNDISNLFPKTKIGTREVLDVWNAFNITDDFKKNTIAIQNYLVEEGDTWSSISQKIYGDRRLWWVIALYNNIEDPFQLYYDFGVKEKTVRIQIMNQEYIFSLLNEINKRLRVVDFESLDE